LQLDEKAVRSGFPHPGRCRANSAGGFLFFKHNLAAQAQFFGAEAGLAGHFFRARAHIGSRAADLFGCYWAVSCAFSRSSIARSFK
jgi:hypothetical protein